MPITVTRTKIIIPRRKNDLLSRKRLNLLLDDLLDYKLLLIAAPAGYGKTSLLVDWAHQIDLPVCWYALDPLDQDLTRFISYLIASIAQVFPAFGSQSRAALENYSGSRLKTDRIITAIVNDAYENIKEHFAVVLDDFHAVDAVDEINEFVNRFSSEIDENCHLIIASRTLLALPDLPLMVGRSMVKGLSYDELAFQADEIQALLKLNYHQTITGDVAEELQRETEGWITGLLLSAQTMWQGMTDRVRVARASGVGLYDYLAQQVLDQQSALVRDFLLTTSLLEEFDAELCQAVFGDAPHNLRWFDLIREVLQNNLFVLPVDDHGTWLRYHHLFRDFLQDQILRESPERVKFILRRLAAVYIHREAWEKAYEIYQRIQDDEGIIALIERAGISMVKNRQLNTLSKWLNRLNPAEIQKRPPLLSIIGALDILMGSVESGISYLNQAESLLEQAGDRHQLALLLMRRSTGHRFLGNYQEALADVEKALLLVDGVFELRDVYAETLRLKGLGYYRLGNLGEAIQFLEEALRVFQSLSHPQNEALTHGDLGLAYMESGYLSEALSHCEQALSFWHRSGNIARQVNVLNNMGVLYHRQGMFAQAGKYLDETLILTRKSGNIRIEAYALASIGDLYADLDAFDAASEAYRLAREISARINNPRLLIYTYLAEASIYRRQGDLSRADGLLEFVTDLIQKSDSTYEKGLHRLISGQVALGKGESSLAIYHLEAAVDFFQRGGQDGEAIHAYLALARAYEAIADLHQSCAYLDSALQLSQGPTSLHTLVIASREAESVLQNAACLPDFNPDVHLLASEVKEFKTRIPKFRRLLRQQKPVIAIEKAPHLTIQTFGNAQVLLDGEPVSVPEWRVQNTVRELFFLLLANPDGLSKDEIGLILWPNSTQKQLKVQFKNALYRMRRALGKDVVVFAKNEDSYRFNWAMDYEYDVETFQREIKKAQNANGSERLKANQVAVQYYQGSYYPDGEGLWVVPERERLWRSYLQAELSLAQHALDKGEGHAALANLYRILSQDACQEEAHRLAMKAHAAMGSQADLIRQYEVCKDSLNSLLGVSPSPQTEALFLELRSEK